MNTFGRLFRVTTFGESHGPAIGVVIDGCPPLIPLAAADLIPYLARRRPGIAPGTSERREEDTPEILSGVFNGLTTGTPIAILIRNRDTRPDDYEEIRHLVRPGHADFTYQAKYGIRDHRGGGRSSGRETAARVAAGAVATRCLAAAGVTIRSSIMEIGGETTDDGMQAAIQRAMAAGDSVGGIVQVVATGSPPGLGDPVAGKLDAAIAGAMMGIGAVKGVAIGEGFAAARMTGSMHNDQIGPGGFMTNHAGGILGGISTGQEIVVTLAIKPTPSITITQATIDDQGAPARISVKGRHDTCIVPRILPVAEAMLALVLVDALLAQLTYKGFSDLVAPYQREQKGLST